MPVGSASLPGEPGARARTWFGRGARCGGMHLVPRPMRVHSLGGGDYAGRRGLGMGEETCGEGFATSVPILIILRTQDAIDRSPIL
jgi:hypothetical protein